MIKKITDENKKKITELIFFSLAIYLIIFANNIDLFATLTGYIGRVIFILISLFGVGIFSYKFIKEKKYIGKNDIKIFSIIALIGFTYIALNGLYYNNITRLMYGVYQYILYTFVFFAIYTFINKENIKSFFNCIIVINVISSCIIIYEYIVRDNLIYREAGQIAFEGVTVFRGRAFFGSFLNAGVVLSMASFIAIYFIIIAIKEKNAKFIGIYLTALLLYISAIFCTGSRGPLVSLIGGIILGGVMYCVFLSKNIKKTLSYIGGMVIVSAVILIAILNINTENIENKSVGFMVHRVQTVFNWNTDPGNVERIKSWQFGIELFKEKPLIGVGIASTGAKGVGEFSLGPTESGIIKKMAEMGIVGVVLIYLLYMYSSKVVIVSLLNNKISEKQKVLLMLLLSAIVSVIIEEFIYQAMEAEVVAIYFWTFTALIFKINNNNEIV